MSAPTVARTAASTSAVPIALPKSVIRHTAAELTYAGCDDLTSIVHFAAPSQRAAGRVNTVSLDTATGQIHCDCKGAECGQVCWHACYIVAAWQRHQAVAEARALTNAKLLKYGKKHAFFVANYRARVGRAGEYDAVRLLAARWEYRQRRALAAMPLAA